MLLVLFYASIVTEYEDFIIFFFVLYLIVCAVVHNKLVLPHFIYYVFMHNRYVLIFNLFII